MKINYVPLSQTQLGIYFDCVRMGEGAYNRHFLFTIDDSIDMKRLASAIEKAVKAHPYMNVKIIEQDGEPRQYIPEELEEYKQNILEMTENEWKKFLPNLISKTFETIGRTFV